MEKFEIGRFLHLKSEIRHLKLDGGEDGSSVQFQISNLRCRNRPISNFLLYLDGRLTSQPEQRTSNRRVVLPRRSRTAFVRLTSKRSPLPPSTRLLAIVLSA